MNTRMLTLSAALLATLPLAAPAQTTPAATPQAVTLRYKWTPGEVRRYQMTMDSNMAMTMSGQGSRAPGSLPAMATHMVMAYDLAVQSVNPADGSATLTEHITQMTGTLNGSPLPGMNAAADAYKSGFTIVMSPAGKVLSMQMPPSVAGKMPPGMDFSKMFDTVPGLLPLVPVQVGDTWQSNAGMHMFDRIPGMPALQITVFSSLEGISKAARPIASIRQAYQGTLGGPASAGTAGTPNINGQFRGSTLMKFDVDNGSVAGQDGTFAMDTSVRLPKMPGSVPKAMQMRVQMTTHLERLPGASN